MKSPEQNKTKKIALLVLMMSAFCHLLYADANSLYQQANKFYQLQQYDKAIVYYDSLLKTNHTAPEIFFNLGNAFYKSGNYTAAILNYERAKKLNPEDEDINFNLKLANQNTVDKIEPAPQVFYEKWWENFLNSSSPAARSKTGLLLLYGALILSLAYIFSSMRLLRKISFFSALTVLVVGGFFIFLAYSQNQSQIESMDAIIFESSTYVKSSPDEKSTNLFMLHSGTKVEIMDELEGWKKVKIANGNLGWIPANAVEII